MAEDLCDESGSLSMVRLTTEPAAFHSKLTSVMMCKHMDDVVLVGPDEALDRTSDCNGHDRPFENELSTVGVGDKNSRETSDQDGAGISGQAACETFDSLLSCAGLETCNPVQSPGVRCETRVLDEPFIPVLVLCLRKLECFRHALRLTRRLVVCF